MNIQQSNLAFFTTLPTISLKTEGKLITPVNFPREVADFFPKLVTEEKVLYHNKEVAWIALSEKNFQKWLHTEDFVVDMTALLSSPRHRVWCTGDPHSIKKMNGLLGYLIEPSLIQNPYIHHPRPQQENMLCSLVWDIVFSKWSVEVRENAQTYN